MEIASFLFWATNKIDTDGQETTPGISYSFATHAFLLHKITRGIGSKPNDVAMNTETGKMAGASNNDQGRKLTEEDEFEARGKSNLIIYEDETTGDERSKIQVGNQPSILAVEDTTGVDSTEPEPEFTQEPTSGKLFDDRKEQLEDPYAWVRNADGTEVLIPTFEDYKNKVVSFGLGKDPTSPCDMVIGKDMDRACVSRLAFRIECRKDEDGLTMFEMDASTNHTDAMTFWIKGKKTQRTKETASRLQLHDGDWNIFLEGGSVKSLHLCVPKNV